MANRWWDMLAEWSVIWALIFFAFHSTNLATNRAAGSESELWPTYLDAEYLEDYNCSIDKSRLEDPKCPSGGYLSLYTYLSRWWNFANAPHEIQLHDRRYAQKHPF